MAFKEGLVFREEVNFCVPVLACSRPRASAARPLVSRILSGETISLYLIAILSLLPLAVQVSGTIFKRLSRWHQIPYTDLLTVLDPGLFFTQQNYCIQLERLKKHTECPGDN